MVRPIVEYACPVWNPHQQYLSDKLERVQRNASRWILGSSIDYSERLEYLGWPTLNSRREFLSLVQLFKFINGFSRVDLCNYLTFSNSRTRSTNNVKIWTPYARTNILKNSFWYKYIKIWNDSPNDIISSSSASKLKKNRKNTFLTNINNIASISIYQLSFFSNNFYLYILVLSLLHIAFILGAAVNEDLVPLWLHPFCHFAF